MIPGRAPIASTPISRALWNNIGVTPPTPVTDAVKTGTGGIDAPGRAGLRKGRHVPIFKPTGFRDVDPKKHEPKPELPELPIEIVAASADIVVETTSAEIPSVHISMADISTGIDTRVTKTLVNDDEERILILFLASQI